eukprot:TRINITY_DN10550_c0_g1_i1.p1 TRINITY_DN10550_c0_g1~~TRINITY_DN10550_c0_g1_i1.p1  ORF type:complete len:682 (+),score=146.18 TRINITY_DN10550_c0_g1_i1:222-2267(+)
MGKGGGKGGGRVPWAYIHAVDGADTLGLMAMSKQIPETWVDWKRGGKRGADRMHSTVLLQMTKPEHLERLKSLAETTEPFKMKIGSIFCERVDRIKDAEIYCIGASLKSPELRVLKDAWCTEETPQQRKVHVPYDSEGHISLAYVRAPFKAAATSFAEKQTAALKKAATTLEVTHISYMDEGGRETDIPLSSGSGSSEPPRKVARREKVDIDGSVLEGGGQILRMSGAYSALFGIPINITKIRAGRSKPGLAAQHLESFRLVRDTVRGTLKNDSIGSTEVTFAPGTCNPGEFSADPGTAGAITLMVQASLFPLLFAGGRSLCHLRGGTDVGFSPPLDFLTRVLTPTLRRMGAEVQTKCIHRGFFPRGQGHVEVSVPGLTAALKPIDMSEKGQVQKISAVMHCTKDLGRDKEAVMAAVRLPVMRLCSGAKVDIQVVQDGTADSRVGKLWLDVIAETSTGSIFHGSSEPADLPGYGKGGKGGGRNQAANIPQLAANAAEEACKPLKKQLDSGSAVDEHLLDQLIMPASLAAGKSRFLTAEPSMHTLTALYITELFLPKTVNFNKTPTAAGLYLIEVEGTGQLPTGAAGKAAAPQSAEPAAVTEEVIRLRRRALSAAAPALLTDFQNDMEQVGLSLGVSIGIDIEGDRLNFVPKDAGHRQSVLNQLWEVLEFYFPKSSAPPLLG